MNINGMNLALKEITGSKNVLIKDDLGTPSVMVKIPRFNLSDVISGAPDTPHPMFIVDGVVKDAIYIGKYLSTIWDLRAYSLPGRDPAVNMTLDDAKRYACTKGPGWHVMSNAERAGIALWCKANGYFPYGNTNGGKSAAKPVYRGTPSINTNVGTFSVGDVTKIANANTDDFISFNKSNATEMKIESFEGASLNGTTFVGGKVSCTLDKDVMDKIEKVDFYVNKRADSICDTMNLLPGINQNTIYNSDGSSQPCVLHEGDTYKMWFTGLHSGNSIMYTTSKDLVNWTTPIVSIKYGTSPECSVNACMANVINDNGTYRIWFMGYDGSHGRILHATSNDGINWSTPTVVLNYGINSTNTIHNCEPCVIKDGITYKMWLNVDSNNNGRQVAYCSSNDGLSWSAPVIVTGIWNSPNGYSTYPTVIKDGNMYKMWVLDSTCQNVMYGTSTDGLAWGNFVKAVSNTLTSYTSGTYCMNRPFVLNDAGVYRVWYSGSVNSGTNWRILYAVSNDGKIISSPQQVLTSYGARFNGNHCVIKDGSTYKMWSTYTDGSNPVKIQYSESADGKVWAAPIIVLSAAHHPWVIKESDNMYKMWYVDFAAGYDKVAYATSTDGKTWQNMTVLIDTGSGNQSTVPCVIKESDTLYKMWYATVGNGCINYATSTDGKTWTGNTIVASPSVSQFAANTISYPIVMKNARTGLYQMISCGFSSSGISLLYSESNDGKTFNNWSLVKSYTTPPAIQSATVLFDPATSLYKFYLTDATPTVYMQETSDIKSLGPVSAMYTGYAYNSVHSAEPCTIFDPTDNKYKMWFAANDGTNWRIMYTESLDLISWITPILALDKNVVPFNAGGSADPTVVRKSDGTFLMVCECWDGGSMWRIASSTSIDGKTWTAPIALIDTTAYRHKPCLVLEKDGSYKLWFLWKGDTPAMYMSTSTDGTKWSDPVTCNNVITNGTAGMVGISVVYHRDRYLLFVSNNGAIYEQYSYDGVNWLSDIAGRTTFLPATLNQYCKNWSTGSTLSIVQIGGRYAIFVSGNDGTNTRILVGFSPFLTIGSRIRVTTSDGTVSTQNIEPFLNVSPPKSVQYGTLSQGTPCVIKESDTSYKMWFVGSDGTNNRILYSTSNDGKIWRAPIIVMDRGTSAYNTIHSYAPYVIKESDTSYKMWFAGSISATTQILYSTSTDGKVWTAPVLAIAKGVCSQASANVYMCSVIKESSGTYKMWFDASDSTNYRIMYATSVDGVVWSTPVLTMDKGSCIYNTINSTGPRVIKESDSSYKMWFSGYDGTVSRILYCTSSDGISWSTPVLAIGLNTSYNIKSSFDISVTKDKDRYRVWFSGLDSAGIGRTLYSESPNGVTDWSTDINSPIKLRNLSYTAAQNSADGYINATITSIQPGYQVNTAFEVQSTGTLTRIPMRNAKRIQFEIRSAASKDGKTPAKVLFGYFATNGNIQDIYVQSNSRSGGDGSTYIYSKSGVNLIAKVTPTGYVVSGSDGCINADGICVVSAACVDSNDTDDAYAKINVVDVYGDTDITRTLTGTCGTGHDGSIDGIMDLTGNIWELITGVKIIGGKILITPDNDSATQFYSDKYYWSAIDQGGNLIDPNDAGALYYDGAAGATTINTKVTTQIGTSGASTSFKALTAASGVAVPTILKALGLFPVDGNDHGDATLKYKTTEEGYAMFGGDANSMMANGGLFTLSFLIGQGIVSPSAGFRVCYYNP